MKLILLLLTLVSSTVFANCEMKSASFLENQRQVGPVTDLVKNKSNGKCSVTFRLNVDGTWHNLKQEVTGWEQEEALCYFAVERARKNLLYELGGKFKTEAVTVCSDGKPVNRKIKIGDVILETEVGNSKLSNYFEVNNRRCRFFTERYDQNRKLQVYHGVICQTDRLGANWLVIDKW